MKRLLSLLFCAALPMIGSAAVPRIMVPFDGTAQVIGKEGENIQSATVHGKSLYVNGISGKALSVCRHAYDQVTAVNFNNLPVMEWNQGTVSFFFRPNNSKSDGKGNWLLYTTSNGKLVNYMIYFPEQKKLELSVYAPRQRYMAVKKELKPNQWVHLAFSWNHAKGEVTLYVDGNKVSQRKQPKWENPDFKLTKPLNIWLGRRGSDRFSAKVAEGDFDTICFYETQLSDAEIKQEAMNNITVKMNSVPLDKAIRNGDKFSLIFSADKNRFKSVNPLLKIKGSSGAAILFSSMGRSGRTQISGGEKVLESPYVFNHKIPLTLTIQPEGKSAKIWFDDAFQGELKLPKPFGKLASIEAIPEIVFQDQARTEAENEVLTRKASTELEKKLWKTDDAWRRTTGSLEELSLNGFWRGWSGNSYRYAPDQKQQPIYSRVPGSLRSSWFAWYKEKDGELVKLPMNRERRNTATWYQRTFKVPAEWSGKHIFLHFDDILGEYGRIYLNGKLVDTFQRMIPHYLAIPNERRVEITDFLQDENVLTVFLDRTAGNLYLGRYETPDEDAVIAIDNVYLEAAASSVRLKNALILPSFQNKNAEFRTWIFNPKGIRGNAVIKYDLQCGEDRKEFTKEFQLTGESVQKVNFVEDWKNPVLWSFDEPNLYTQKLTLSINGKKADTMPERKFGFREAWVENGSFYFNGHPTRYRMSTAPGLNDFQFRNTRAISHFVSGIKNQNYNAVRFDPHPMMGRSTINYREYLEECDKQGLCNLFPLPFYNNHEMQGYLQSIEEFMSFYGKYTNIIMWYTDFNTCHYQRNQDPYYLNNTAYLPETVIEPRRKAMVAQNAIQKLDKTREVFQHAGGNSGKIFTSMNYQCYGTPLQEQEDWPKIWAANHTQPLMVVETGFLFDPQIFYFDKPGYRLIAENCSRFFGDKVFRAEKEPQVFNPNVHRYPEYIGMSPNYFRLASQHYRRVVRAWRGYGISALGDFVALGSYRPSRGTYPWHNKVFWKDDIGIKSPGVRPDDALFGGPRFLYTVHAPIANVIQKEYAPLRIFIGGTPEYFTNKDHAFWSDETITKSAVIINDLQTKQKLELVWNFTVNGEIIQRGEETVSIAPGEIIKMPITFKAPRVGKKSQAKLSLSVFRNNKAYDTDEFAMQIFPKRAKPDFRYTAPAALYDPVGKTEELLKKANFPYRKVSNFNDLMEHRLLIIGQDALKDQHPDFLRELEESGELATGYKVLVFEQQPCNLANFVFESPSYREAFIRRTDSAYLKGLSDEDLRNWRGSSDTRPEKIVSEEKTKHYPRSKWKIGNSGMVAGNVIRKPSNGIFRTYVDCGPNLMFSALMEAEKGHGLLLFCQLDVTKRYGEDPAATLLVDNILAEFSRPVLAQPPVRAIYFGDDKNEARLKALGVDYVKGNKLSDIESLLADAILIGRDPAPNGDQKAFAKKIEKLTGKQIIVCLPGAPLELLPLELKNRTITGFKAELPETNPIFAGISEADLYYRSARKFTVVDGPQWMSSTKPAIFASVNTYPDAKPPMWPGGTTVVLNLAPDDFNDLFWNSEKVSRVWNTIFVNLGIGTGKDQQFFTNGKMRHNTMVVNKGTLPLKSGMIQFDPQNLGKVDKNATFKPIKIGRSWEEQGFLQKNPYYQYPANTPDKLKKSYDGHAWIRISATIPDSWKGKEIHLIGGPIDDADRTWFNGTLIGETQLDKVPDAYSRKRSYPIPAEAIRFGEENEILIQVTIAGAMAE